MKSIRFLLPLLVIAITADVATASLPPLPVPMDVVLKQAERIIVGRVQPGSVKTVAKDKESFREFTLLVTRAIDGKDIGKAITIAQGSFPAMEFPPSKAHPKGRFLLTGWGERGGLSREAIGLDLYADQVWFLQRIPDTPYRFGVVRFESVQPLEHAGLIELLARRAPVAKLRKHIEKEYKGKTPVMAVQALYGSHDEQAGAFAWDYLVEFEVLAKKLAALDLKMREDASIAERLHLRMEMERYAPNYAFRTFNSLGRVDALKWSRKTLDADSPLLYYGALETFKRFRDTDSVPKLLDRLAKTADHHQRESIITTLGEIGDRRAIPALIDALTGESHTRPALHALFLLTDIRFSPNGDYAKRWWERNKEKPRWHWLKQGIEQDLHLLDKKHLAWVTWDRDLEPITHLSRVTCWHFPRGPEHAASWAKWWQANKDLPQERWLLDSFKAVGHPLPDLASEEAVAALIKAYNTKPDYWRDQGPVLDPYLHHYWCQRLLTRLTGWHMEDTHYVHYYSSHWFDYEKLGPLWQDHWKRNRGQKLNAIDIPAKQPFTMDAEDRRLLCEDFASWQVAIAFKSPLVRKTLPTLAGKHLRGTFEITLTNRSSRPLTLMTKPQLTIHNGIHECSGSVWGRPANPSATHKDDFARVLPGESIRWLETESLSSWENEKTWVHFELHFKERGKADPAWRGSLATPWLMVQKGEVREEP